MKKKSALKGLLVLVGVLLASAFLSRTVQTITTPKIRVIQATRGKLEDRLTAQAALSFPGGVDVYARGARKMGMVITDVLAQQGYFVKTGDLLARAELPTMEDELDKAQADYETAVRALGEHIATQVRLAQDSPHNQVYERYFVALQEYYDTRLVAQEQARAEGVTLPGAVADWGVAAPSQGATPAPAPAALADIPDTLLPVMQAAFDKWKASEAVFAELRRIYTGNGPVARVGAATFDYIKKVDELERAVAARAEDLVELHSLGAQLEEIRAAQDGYLTAFTLKAGDAYDGAKPLYQITGKEQVPALVADITGQSKTIAKGTQVEVEGVQERLTVSEVTALPGGKTSVRIVLTNAAITQLGGIQALLGGERQVTFLYKSQKTTALLPAGAVRTDTDGSSFVYTVEQNWGGLLGNTRYTLKKQTVTVAQRSNSMVALTEDVSYLRIAAWEDRALTDGAVVMEYVD